jgi:RND family efflux transporter MFP subunit
MRRVAFILMTVALAACSGEADEAASGPKSAMTVTAAQVETRTVARTIAADGSVVAWEDIAVAAEAGAGGLAVAETLAEAGDAVKAGQVLARLNDATLKAQRDQAAANVTAARATLDEARANGSRARDLLARGVISAQTADQRLAASKTAAAQLVQAQAALAEVEARLNQAVITAPVAGYISSRNVVIGQIVQGGSELFRIVRDGRLELVADVADNDIALLRAGLGVQVFSDTIPAVEGRIRLVSPQIDPRTRLGRAYVALPISTAFKPGMFVRATIALDAGPALFVPQASIVFRDGKSGLFVLSPDRVATFRPIETGQRSDTSVEVLGGVAAGEQIVVQGAGFLETGDHVTVSQ